MITLDDLKAICPLTKAGLLALYVEPLSDAMREFNIDNPAREAAFIAQIAHESGCFRYVKELASGQAYEGRHDLGNIQSGDGVRFKGRGLIQITGRTNYYQCGNALGADLTARPELLEQPGYACRSAAWFWATHSCNELADLGDFVRITRKINGGTNGLAERIALHEKAQEVLA